MGQKQKRRPKIAMSALLPKADITERDQDDRFVPTYDLSLEIASSVMDSVGGPAGPSIVQRSAATCSTAT
jgi:hypothetical protein